MCRNRPSNLFIYLINLVSNKFMNKETKAREKLGPRSFTYTRKITLSNYDARRRFETEDFSCTHDSFEEARAVVQEAVEKRIAELSGIKELATEE